MAKDGTRRGGARPGAGRKRSPQLKNGCWRGHFFDLTRTGRPDWDGLSSGQGIPESQSEMRACSLSAADVFEDTWKWLAARGCEKLVSQNLIEQYAMSVLDIFSARPLFLTTDFSLNPLQVEIQCQSPYVAMSQNYMKQANQIWYQIFQVVKENCTESWSGNTPQDNVMELLLRKKG